MQLGHTTNQSAFNPNRLSDDHATQFELLKSLFDAIADCPETEQVVKIFDQLLSYTGLHFLSEQLLMQQYDYSEYDQHSQDHSVVMERLRSTQLKFRNQPSEVFSGEVDQIETLLSEHIENHDNSLHQFLSRKNRN